MLRRVPKVAWKKARTDHARQYKRLYTDYLVRYETDASGEPPHITNIKNLSAGGLKFLTKEPLQENATIKVVLLIPSLERPFRAQGRIVRVRCLKKRMIYSVAITFTDISPTDRDVINRYIEELAEDPMAKLFIDTTVDESPRGKGSARTK
ncbi:MAG: PilZ domain-containing protein [Candidatus Omnitrophica bacterium]|nr:PilZ domain-containing protein [Candidatus Omnitrophota bacterium]MDD5671977.1 PilZ domain-containing protein [Candidatus Omnitrophota bacterium]